MEKVKKKILCYNNYDMMYKNFCPQKMVDPGEPPLTE